MNPRLLQRVAISSLIALMLLAIAHAWPSSPGMSWGTALAVVKILLLAVMLMHIRRADVYAMQWSSMLILLFVAEGVARAMSDPQPSAALGGIEAVVAGIFFFAVLAYLRPLKNAARESKL
ncbi:MAG: DUF2069 domain-containing protein [Burkholderiaceae bacterium]